MTARKRAELKRLRLRVMEVMANADIDPIVLIGNMALVCKWVETGIVPRKITSKVQLGLVPVQQQ